jgi:glycosyltransferase involved in cell wall biosynthesis
MLIGVDASRAILPQRTGTENYSLYLIQALSRVGPGHRYRLYTREMPPPGLLPSSANVEVRSMPWPRLWTHGRLSWEMLWHPPDLLFVPAHVLPLIHPPSSVVTVHDLGYLYYPQAHPPFQRWYLDCSTRYHCRVAAHIIADCQVTKDDLIRHYRAVPERITVIYAAYDAERYRPADSTARTSARARYGLEGPYLLYVGTLQPRKNLSRLLEAFARLRETREELTLVIVGKKGWLYEPLFRQVRELGLETSVFFTGYIPEDDLPLLLSGATAFVLPALYEGFGLPVLEAMACGTPVVCSNVASLPEVAGDAALLADPLDVEDLAEAMMRIVEDTALRRELVARGLERVRTFSWERCARQTLEVLEKVGQSG